jgi:hypothetical protein
MAFEERMQLASKLRWYPGVHPRHVVAAWVTQAAPVTATPLGQLHTFTWHESSSWWNPTRHASNGDSTDGPPAAPVTTAGIDTAVDATTTGGGGGGGAAATATPEVSVPWLWLSSCHTAAFAASFASHTAAFAASFAVTFTAAFSAASRSPITMRR